MPLKLHWSSKPALWKPVGAAASYWCSNWEKFIRKYFAIFSHFTCLYLIIRPRFSFLLSFFLLSFISFCTFFCSSLSAFLLMPHLWLFPPPSIFLSLPHDYTTASLPKSTEGLTCSFWEQSFSLLLLMATWFWSFDVIITMNSSCLYKWFHWNLGHQNGANDPTQNTACIFAYLKKGHLSS